MAEETQARPATEKPEGAELSEDDLSKVSGGTGVIVTPVPIKITLTPGPGIGLPTGTQHGDPHVTE
jgi:hypothetical protein